MMNLWRQLREVIFYPLLYTLLPLKLKFRLVKRIQAHCGLYKNQVDAMRAAVPVYMAQADLESCARELRLTHLVDHSDVFTTLLRFKSGLSQCVLRGELPCEGSLILGAHRSNAWWLLPSLAHGNLPAHFISAPLIHPPGFAAACLKPYRLLRWFLLNRIGKATVIPMQGAVRATCQALARNEHVVALIDLPTRIARQTQPVRFLNKTAFMPRRLIDAALDKGHCVYYCRNRLSTEDLRIEMELIALPTDDGPASVFQQYVCLVEEDIQHSPGSWHCWGHVELFFEAPSSPLVS
jgi:hypothetical protein